MENFNFWTPATLSENLHQIHQSFWQTVQETHPIFATLVVNTDVLRDNLCLLGTIFEDFVSGLFNNRLAVTVLQQTEQKTATILMVQRQFVQRQALKRYTIDSIDLKMAAVYQEELERITGISLTDELEFSQHILKWMDTPSTDKNILQKAQYYCAAKVYYPDETESLLFTIPGFCFRESGITCENHTWTASVQKERQFFSLTDPGLSVKQSLNHVHYCLKCHTKNKDTCRTGISGQDLPGCPLNQKISEMILLKSLGLNIAALALAMVDNPLLALTGHRICQDCSNSCIYQPRMPVQVPGIETQILESILNLPWGFEMYYLLTYWNPFNLQRSLPRPPSGKNVLVCGLGPAGLNLAYHLLQDGHDVVAVDGLKIEPLDEIIPNFDEPIPFIKTFFQDLDHRKPQGVGGVCEYGITSRWNKNYLTLVRLILQRRERFSVWGGIFIDIDHHTETVLGFFDHIALCTGTRTPQAIPLFRHETNHSGYVKGIRFASDFLMTLQGAGACHPQSLVNLTLELPAVVIGGGLTAIDTAVEALAYYPRQVLKLWRFYQEIIQKNPNFLDQFSVTERQTVNQWLTHAQALQQEQRQAKQQNRPPHFLPLLKQWGGVTLCYRGHLKDAPSYHQCVLEIEEALQQGVVIKEKTQITDVVSDSDLQVQAITVQTPSGITQIKAKTVLLATGMQHSAKRPVPENPFIYAQNKNHIITYFGDAHPEFRGSVVKAMASAKEGYPFITEALKHQSSKQQFIHQYAEQLFTAQVVRVEHFPDRCKVTVQYPWGSCQYQPGHFFRLQLFQKFSQQDYIFEAIAVQISDYEGQELTFVLKKQGASSTAYQALTPGMKVILTGPTGSAYVIPRNKRVLIIVQQSLVALYQPLLQKIETANSLTVFQIDKILEDKTCTSYDDAQLKILFQKEEFDTILILTDASLSQQLSDNFSRFFSKIPTVGICCPPMQCMMKGLCGQCIQATTNGEVLFACENIYHPFPTMDYTITRARLNQNSIQEKFAQQIVEWT